MHDRSDPCKLHGNFVEQRVMAGGAPLYSLSGGFAGPQRLLIDDDRRCTLKPRFWARADGTTWPLTTLLCNDQQLGMSVLDDSTWTRQHMHGPGASRRGRLAGR